MAKRFMSAWLNCLAGVCALPASSTHLQGSAFGQPPAAICSVAGEFNQPQPRLPRVVASFRLGVDWNEGIITLATPS